MTSILPAESELNITESPDFPGTVTPVGWIPPEQDIPIDDWVFHVTGALQIKKSIHFILGDLISYGKAKYGQKYAQALDWTDYTYGTLANDRWVCEQIPISLRNENLSWTHHYLVARFDHKTIERLLKKAIERDWTTSETRHIINRWRRVFYGEGRRPLKDAALPTSTPAASVLPLHTTMSSLPVAPSPLPWKRMAKRQWKLSRAWRKRAIIAENRATELQQELADLYDRIAEGAIFTHKRDDGRLEKVK